jgi:hypothetical protein
MALNATIHSLTIDLSDVDRGGNIVGLGLPPASETPEFALTRYWPTAPLLKGSVSLRSRRRRTRGLCARLDWPAHGPISRHADAERRTGKLAGRVAAIPTGTGQLLRQFAGEDSQIA